MSLRRIIHVAQITFQPTSGMGRVACEWKAAALRAGIEFVHLGAEEIGPVRHRLLFPPKARKLAEKLIDSGSLLLVHEPSAWAFRGLACPKVAFSHGFELRGYDISLSYETAPFKSKLSGPLFRWLGKRGLLAMDRILAINTDDAKYLIDRKLSLPNRIKVFRNGVDSVPALSTDATNPGRSQTIIFNGSWLKRKGIKTLVQSAVRLAESGIRPNWLLTGTGLPEEVTRADWPPALRADLTIIPGFQREDEIALLARAGIFVLPSYFEGQPLALLQAMAAGLCCITTDSCGQKDIIQHGENGLLFTPGDDKGFADCIRQAWENPGWAAQIGANARISVSDRTWPAVSDEVINWLQHVTPT